ncbi:unnamed protein product [Linum trigynum]|uniref:Uncharacterized protein n=1 Tax=Linum trigynum TaxID=586398 RepID=A0AAV2FQ65_9ROSI
MGQYTQIHNGLGWLGLEDGPEGDELSLADQPVKWAEPEVDQRGPGGLRRTAEPGGRPGIGRAAADRAEMNQTGPGRAGMGRPEVGRTSHRPSPTAQHHRRVDSREPDSWEGPYAVPPAPGGYPNLPGSYPGDYGQGNPNRMSGSSFG